MCILAPSLLAADFRYLLNQIEIIEQTGIQYLHLDLMDGVFVPNLSIGTEVIQSIRDSTQLVFDVHMMVSEPIRLIPQVKEAGADVIIVHVEACSDVMKTINCIREHNARPGIAISPETRIDQIEDRILEATDVVHLMSVMPGRRGQAFIPGSIKRIVEMKKRIVKLGLDIDIEVDGKIDLNNIHEVLDAGANIIVIGSALFHGDLEHNISIFQDAFTRSNSGG